MALIAPEELNRRVQELPGWTLDGAALRRTFTFRGFPDAVAFIVRLGFLAEAADHHPDLAGELQAGHRHLQHTQ